MQQIFGQKINHGGCFEEDGVRAGWSDKEAAAVLGIEDPRKTSQALVPAVRKVAALMRRNAHKTLLMLMAEMDRQEQAELHELRMREDAADGRADRGLVFGRCAGPERALPRRCPGV